MFPATDKLHNSDWWPPYFFPTLAGSWMTSHDFLHGTVPATPTSDAAQLDPPQKLDSHSAGEEISSFMEPESLP
jgi:hypothetical protein